MMVESVMHFGEYLRSTYPLPFLFLLNFLLVFFPWSLFLSYAFFPFLPDVRCGDFT